jgi:hypothetical protein
MNSPIFAALQTEQWVTLSVFALLFAFWVWMVVDCALYEDPGQKGLFIAFMILFALFAVVFFTRRSPRIKRRGLDEAARLRQ